MGGKREAAPGAEGRQVEEAMVVSSAEVADVAEGNSDRARMGAALAVGEEGGGWRAMARAAVGAMARVVDA